MILVGGSDLSRRLHRPSFNQAIELGAQAGSLGIGERWGRDPAVFEIDQLLAPTAHEKMVGVGDCELGWTTKPEVFGERFGVNRPVGHRVHIAFQHGT
jgi:hypothetical protein